jgi:hypothetical protein
VRWVTQAQAINAFACEPFLSIVNGIRVIWVCVRFEMRFYAQLHCYFYNRGDGDSVLMTAAEHETLNLPCTW